ncbi:acyltransferase family protein [Flavihumibacter petaseus]|uniref:Putative acyltransferase n=1 Tax=Flavihumibacter petaseus NBRC 106054 TaxID=1220578 RepID=A0A0E9MVE9_9BACT|nr:acyltransferase [Flavihumibacter petaseus]GAO41458.1 putative acyltransferase [Flavihumibacter petaseus NBRC 106054]
MTPAYSTFKDTRQHYEILDGLRGIAAILVVMFHLLETFALGNHEKQLINHGYLAVDFFFLLSGFVMGYAYDERWDRMSMADFCKRRLIRLHPMIIVGSVIGAFLFYFQDSPAFPGIHDIPVGTLLLTMVIGFTLIPVPPSMDIRGWAEMHPLNGPAWSLFFEYIANILYAVVLRHCNRIILSILTAVAAAALIHLAVTSAQGDVIGGWSVDPVQLRIGFTRLLYPFLAGLLLSRVTKPGNIKNAFLWSGLLLVVMLSMPRIGNSDQHWLNGLYDSLSIVLIFPVVVYLGASGSVEGRLSGVNRFLGRISYPLYIIHYPFIYTFVAWVSKYNITPTMESPGSLITCAAVAAGILAVNITLAWLLVKYYDEPVRKWLTGRFFKSL